MPAFTKKAIMASFIGLLNETPFDKITVKDIVVDCGINRNTFYYYYQDIYELINELFDEELKKVEEGRAHPENWYLSVTETLSFARDNKRAVYHIYNSVNRKELEKYLRTAIDNVCKAYVKSFSTGVEAEDEGIDLISRIMSDASMGMLFSWLDAGMKDDFDVMLKRIDYLFSGMVRELVEKTMTEEFKSIKNSDRP